MDTKAAVLAGVLLAAASAAEAQQRRVSARQLSSGRFVTAPNRSVAPQSAPRPPSSFKTPPHRAAAASNVRPPAIAAGAGAAPRAFSGGAVRRASNGSWFSDFGGRGYRGIGPLPASSGSSSEPEPAAEPEARAPWAVPGALIRTEGLGFRYEQPAAAPREHRIEAGGLIAMEDSKARPLTSHQGLFVGPRDTPPPPTPGGGASGRNAITERSDTTINIGNGNNNGQGP